MPTYSDEHQGGDSLSALRRFIDERWSVVQAEFYPGVTQPQVQPGATEEEAAFFLRAVRGSDGEPPLFTIDDQRKVRSDRIPPNADGRPRGANFFEDPGRLRLETIVHIAAVERLRSEFGWPREHIIVEAPDVSASDRGGDVSRETLDILLTREPLESLPSVAPRGQIVAPVGIEAKADRGLLAKLVEGMRACSESGPDRAPKHEHRKCEGLEAFECDYFLGVAAGTWWLYDVADKGSRRALGDRVSRLDLLHFGQLE
jgi:hypothetical protein